MTTGQGRSQTVWLTTRPWASSSNVNAYLERRRAQDARELESLHLSSEHAKWLRDERLKAYLSLSIAGEEVLQFIRSELPVLVQPDGMNRRKDAETR